tara:strand:+ start:11432 stop:15772 length:4341 start_codon:yes stop_codon:yes gene_type:complete
MADSLPLGYNINFQSLDEQFGMAENRIDRTEDILAVTGEELGTEEAKSKVRQAETNPYYQVFQRGYEEGKTVDQLNLEASDIGVKNDEFNSNPEFIAEQALSVNNYDYSAADARVATNYQIANEILSDRKFDIAISKTPFQRALNTVDRFLREVSPVGTIEVLTNKTEKQSREILTAAATKNATEFRAWFEAYADEIGQEGIFAKETLGALEALTAETMAAGFDPNKGINLALSALDVIGAAQLVKVGAKISVKTAMKSSTAIGRVGAIRGSDAASESAERVLAVTPDPEVLGNVGPSNLDIAPQPVRPSAAKFTSKFAESKIIQAIDDLYQKGAFGRIADPRSIKIAAKKIAAKYRKNVSNPVFDYKIVDEGLGNFVATVRFGKASDGSVYKPLADGSAPKSINDLAEEIGKKVESARVAPVDVNDLSKGYVIEVAERIDLSGMPRAFDEGLGLEAGIIRDTVGKVMNNSVMGSSAARDVDRLTRLAQMSESARAAVKSIIDPYTRALQRLNAQERYTLQSVYTQLRDGIDSNLRVRYTEGEFAVKYQQMHPRGLAPSEKAKEAYNALAAVEEADYLLKTSMMLNRYVEKGYRNSVEVFDGYYAPAKRVSLNDVPADAKLVDGEFGGKIRKQDLESTDIPIWKLDKPTGDGQEFVVKPKQVRIIEPTDVMGYNVGGSRANPTLKYFVVLGTKRLKALMGTFSEKQARTAVAQLGRIQRAIIDGDNNIDDIIKANNDWNPSIESFDDFKKLADEEGWDFSRGEIAYRGRNDDILSGDVDGSDVFTGMKMDDYINTDMRRNNDVLMDFGGGRAYNEDPINSVLAQMGNSVFTYSNRAYAQNAIVGWVKKAQQKGRNWFPSGVVPTDYETLFRNANISGTDEFSRRMSELRDITMRRLNMKDEASTFMERQGQAVAEYIFDKTGKQLNLGDPSNGLLKIGFQSAFGFGNISQFVMQGFHAATIMAISPVHGFKGAALTIPMRGALRANTPELQQLALQRVAKAADISEKDAGELIEFIKTSGRSVVDGDAIEDGTGVGFGISGWSGENMKYSALMGAGYNVRKLVTKGLDLGLMPFKQGERLSRLTAINTAFFEFKAKFPKVSALSDEARLWITRREQDLTFNMSTVSRGKVQSGFMKVPTQWLSYTLRSMESIFVGRGLTNAERRRLFVALVPMYGLTGFGLANAADYVGEKLGIAPDSDLYITLKYGMLDGLVATLGGDVEVGLGQRLAPVGAITDTYKKIFQEDTITALGGPSGEIAGGVFSAAWGAITALLHGQTATLTEETIKLLRQPSGLDNVAKAIGIFNNGVYRSKNGIELESEMTIGDGIVALTGFTPLEVVENYTRLNQVYTSGKKFSAFRKQVNRDAERIFTLMEGDRNDVDLAIQLMTELHERIAFSGFSASQMASLRRSTGTSLQKSWQKIQNNLIEQDKLYAYQAAQSILKGTE